MAEGVKSSSYVGSGSGLSKRVIMLWRNANQKLYSLVLNGLNAYSCTSQGSIL